MISIRVQRNAQQEITHFSIEGHAMSSPDADVDLLCCAVSVLSQGAVMGLSDVAKIVGAAFCIDDGLLQYTLPGKLTEQQRHDAQIILESMYVSLQSLVSGSADFIQMNDEN